MFQMSRYNTFENVLSDCYIAKKTGINSDDYGNMIPEYELYSSKPFHINIQQVNQSSDVQAFGEKVNRMKVALLKGEDKIEFLKNVKEFDLAYLDGANPDNEEVVGSNANYRVYSIKPQNVALLVYFEKLL